MKSSFFPNFISSFLSFLKALLFVGLSLGAAFAVIFPFWYFADKAPVAYSITIIALIIASLVLLLVFHLKNKIHELDGSQKKAFFFNLGRSFFLLILLLASLVIPCKLVLGGSRVAAIVVLISGFVIFGVFSFVVKKK